MSQRGMDVIFQLHRRPKREAAATRERPVEPADEAVIRRVQRGERELFTLIFDRHHRRLHHFLRGLGVPESEAEDLLAETFCRALARVELFDPDCGTRYLSYLYSIARNLATDHFHHQPMLQPEELDEEMPDGAEPIEDRVIEEICRLEQAALIREAMTRLSQNDREIILLAYDREMSSREIMESMDKPSITAVTTHLYKAMKRLRAHVERLESRRRGG
jgi:RNA polymerase sigma-70 factor (ECF subfamily)